MSIKRLVSVQLAVQDAMENINMFDERMRPLFVRWAEEAELKIGSFYQYRRAYKTVKVGSDKHRAPIPCEVINILGIMCGNISCNANTIYREAYSYYQGYNTGAYTSQNFLINSDGAPVFYNNPIWEIQGNDIVFLSPMQQLDYTLDCLIREVDENGFLMINELHRDACAAYIEMQYAKQSRWQPSEQRISQGDQAKMEYDWNRKCSNARAEDAEPTAAARAQIVSMLNDPLTGSSVGVWRYADEFQYGSYIY